MTLSARRPAAEQGRKPRERETGARDGIDFVRLASTDEAYAAISQSSVRVRIVLLPSAYQPSVGGVELLTNRLAVTLARAGHAVQVWTSRSEGDVLPTRELIDGIVVRRFVFTAPRVEVRALGRWPLKALATLREMTTALAEFNADILHVQCFSNNGAYATALSLLRRVPLFVTLQGETVMDDHDIYDHSLYLRQSLRLAFKRARAVTGCSQFALDDAVRRFGLAPGRGQVVFNGVDADEAPLEPVELPFQRYVLGLGRVVHKKGFDLLIDAFAETARRQTDVGLVVAGSGPELESLRTRARGCEIESRVHFTGKLNRGEVAAVMQGAQMLVMPSRIEPFGIVVLEAWRADVPVVVTSKGGAPEFVEDGVSGLVVDPHDHGALSHAISRLLEEQQLRERVVKVGAARLHDFSWDRISSQYEDIYRSISS